jgi:hypothetical protein
LNMCERINLALPVSGISELMIGKLNNNNHSLTAAY